MRRAGEAHLNVPRAAVVVAPAQTLDGSERGEEPGGMVEHLRRQRPGRPLGVARGGAPLVGYPAGHLDETVEAAPESPRPDLTPGGDVDVDQTRPEPGAVGRSEAEPGEGSRPERLNHDVGLGDEPPQGLPSTVGTQVNVAEALAEARVDDQRGHEGEVVRADPEHLRAVGGERTTGHWSGDDAGEVEDPYALQWSLGGRKAVRGSRVELVHGD